MLFDSKIVCVMKVPFRVISWFCSQNISLSRNLGQGCPTSYFHPANIYMTWLHSCGKLGIYHFFPASAAKLPHHVNTALSMSSCLCMEKALSKISTMFHKHCWSTCPFSSLACSEEQAAVSQNCACSAASFCSKGKLGGELLKGR